MSLCFSWEDTPKTAVPGLTDVGEAKLISLYLSLRFQGDQFSTVCHPRELNAKCLQRMDILQLGYKL
jgi:hypothetical protein